MFNFLNSSVMQVEIKSTVAEDIQLYSIRYNANSELSTINYRILYSSQFPIATIKSYNILYTSEYLDAITKYRIRYTANKELADLVSRYTVKYSIDVNYSSVQYYSVKYFTESAQDSFITTRYLIKYNTEYLTPINIFYRLRYLTEGLLRKSSVIRYKLKYNLEPINYVTNFYSIKYILESSSSISRIFKYKVKYTTLNIYPISTSYSIKYSTETYNISVFKYRIRYTTEIDKSPKVEAILLKNINGNFDILIRVSCTESLNIDNSFLINDQDKYRNILLNFNEHEKHYFKNVVPADITDLEEAYTLVSSDYNSKYYFILYDISAKISLDFAINFNKVRLNSYSRLTFNTTDIEAFNDLSITFNNNEYIAYNNISTYSNKNYLIYNSDYVSPKYVVTKDCCFNKQIDNKLARNSCSPL